MCNSSATTCADIAHYIRTHNSRQAWPWPNQRVSSTAKRRMNTNHIINPTPTRQEYDLLSYNKIQRLALGVHYGRPHNNHIKVGYSRRSRITTPAGTFEQQCWERNVFIAL